MLEMLLVLLVIAVLITLGVSQYRRSAESIRVAAIRNDVATMHDALKRYFKAQGCNADGTFAGSEMPTLAELGLPEDFGHRLPWIDHYTVTMALSGNTFRSRPRYRFIIAAQLDKSLSEKQQTWLKAQFNAARLADHALVWVKFPQRERQMQAQNRFFRQRERIAALAPAVSAANCAQ